MHGGGLTDLRSIYVIAIDKMILLAIMFCRSCAVTPRPAPLTALWRDSRVAHDLQHLLVPTAATGSALR